MAITTNPYCVLQDVKDALALKTTSTANDAWISSLLVQAQTQIDRRIGYSFQAEGTVDAPATKVFSGQDIDFLYVPSIMQLLKVTQTSVGAGQAGLFTQSAQDITIDCYVGPDNEYPGWEVRRFTEIFYQGRRNYAVSGVWGYPTIPLDISRACARIVTHWYKMRDTNYADTLNEQGSIRQKYTKQLPPDVIEILDYYRKSGFYSHD